jgi:hypothetical protein
LGRLEAIKKLIILGFQIPKIMNSNNNIVTFFMIVTGDRDAYLADYAIKSYSKITGIDFQLVVYSNYIPKELKKLYFSNWNKIPYVKLIENNDQDGKSPVLRKGVHYPSIYFEPPWIIWDKYLPNLNSKYVATVDPDFEILSPDFIYYIFKKFNKNNHILGISSDYLKRQPNYKDNHRQMRVDLQERWHTWFIVYRKALLDFSISFRHRHKTRTDSNFIFWDDHGYFQKKNMEKSEKTFLFVPKSYQKQFIHYGGFGSNVDINEENIRFYRLIRILSKNGIWNIPYSRYVALVAEKLIYKNFNYRRKLFHQNYRRFKSKQ